MVIKITRVTNPLHVHHIKSFLVLPDGIQNETYLQQLQSSMQQDPGNVYVLTATAKDELLGFAVANNTPAECIYVSQFYTSPAAPPDVSTELMVRLTLWAFGLGKNFIRAETQRSTEALYRLAGFEPVATVVERRITPNIIQALISNVRELYHGKLLSESEPSNNEQPEPAAGANAGSVG